MPQVLDETLKQQIQTAPLEETLDGRVLEPYTEIILEQIASRIEMRIFMARTAILDDAKIKIASEPAAKRAKQSAPSVERVNDAVYAIGRRYGNEWNRKWFESTRGLYAQLHPTLPVAPKVVESSTGESDDKTVHLKGKRCHEVIAEMRKIKNLVLDSQHTVSEIRHDYPDLKVWQIADGLPADEQDVFNHPRRWGPVVGYARNLLAKDYGYKPDTVRKWVGAYRAANRDKRVKKATPKRTRSKSK